MLVFSNFLLVAVGGAFGSMFRYFSGLIFDDRVFPLGTLFANTIGTLIIGFIMEIAVLKSDFSPEMRLLIATGFCGGLTTLSSLVFETDSLLGSRQVATGILYAIGTLLLAFVALRGGMLLARIISRGVL